MSDRRRMASDWTCTRMQDSIVCASARLADPVPAHQALRVIMSCTSSWNSPMPRPALAVEKFASIRSGYRESRDGLSSGPLFHSPILSDQECVQAEKAGGPAKSLTFLRVDDLFFCSALKLGGDPARSSGSGRGPWDAESERTQLPIGASTVPWSRASDCA
mmetsp:Transcript_93859/g.205456  ORF Transcript_93859/g.205456 Transcript_93859/m.205456 type:complete len:161 (+) Transcript_93859:242-724(+)|eukprot:CAMPEP_0206608366 /NCGR_PEP_ID=MMETSP0325_2-20121206/52951_1 /ASSEMBLY_ACC=CAM_ASM_000347 /TAXON_ID=2866 /ORGANISM="Crypthecodinium cohnii, Strain Seligo" /LENGTH=160 /DNA_ID=CAMNT_0054126053 /DNA_START=152 /DNA_END=634 /DNA_ORIENTATION=-